MQLKRIVDFHKTMGDPTRIRILSLLKSGPLNGQAIAGKLGLKPPTITHHMAKLRDIGLIKERRDKNTIYFYLNVKALEASATAILAIVNEEVIETMEENDRLKILKTFFTADGKLKNLPAQRKKRMVVLEKIISDLKYGIVYEEKELNEYLKKFHDDYATLRRELIMNHYMYRKDNQYEMNPKELWGKM